MTTNIDADDPRLLQLTIKVAEMLNKSEVAADRFLSEIGIDSLNIIEMILICEQIYPGITNPEELVFDSFTTLSDVHEQLASQTESHTPSN